MPDERAREAVRPEEEEEGRSRAQVKLGAPVGEAVVLKGVSKTSGFH
jgi:hypothetical protein